MCRQVASKLLLLVTIVQLPCKADGLVIMCYCKSIFFFPGLKLWACSITHSSCPREELAADTWAWLRCDNQQETLCVKTTMASPQEASIASIPLSVCIWFTSRLCSWSHTPHDLMKLALEQCCVMLLLKWTHYINVYICRIRGILSRWHVANFTCTFGCIDSAIIL